MKTIKELVHDYIKFINNNIIVEDFSDLGISIISTPFVDRHNDNIELYVTRDSNGHLFLSDDAYIINDLKDCGFNFTNKRKQELNNILYGFGVAYKSDTNELFIESSEQDFPQKKHNIIQAILAVNDMFEVNTSISKKKGNLFVEDVKNYLDIHDVIYSSSLNIVGQSKFSHNIDFVLPTSRSRKRKERLIKVVNKFNRQNVQLSLFVLDDIMKIRASENILFINDSGDPEGRKHPDLIEAITSYNVTPLYWTKRNTYDLAS